MKSTARSISTKEEQQLAKQRNASCLEKRPYLCFSEVFETSLTPTLSTYTLPSSHFVAHGRLSQKHVPHLLTVMCMVGSKFIEIRTRGIQYKYVYLVHVTRLFNSLYIELHITYTKSTIQLASVGLPRTCPMQLTIIVGFHQLLQLA